MNLTTQYKVSMHVRICLTILGVVSPGKRVVGEQLLAGVTKIISTPIIRPTQPTDQPTLELYSRHRRAARVVTQLYTVRYGMYTDGTPGHQDTAAL